MGRLVAGLACLVILAYGSWIAGGHELYNVIVNR